MKSSKDCCTFLTPEDWSQRGTRQILARALLYEVFVDPLLGGVSQSGYKVGSGNHLKRQSVPYQSLNTVLKEPLLISVLSGRGI